MCKRGEHEELVPGVRLCPAERTVRVYMDKLRRTLGFRYADMADVEIVLPVIQAILESYPAGDVERIDIFLSGGYLSIPLKGGDQ